VAITHVQGVSANASTSTVGATGSVIGTGNCVCGAITYATTDTLNSVTDDKGNNYAIKDTVTDTTNARKLSSFICGNITNGATTVTANFSAAASNATIVWDEFSGISGSTDPTDVHGGQFQSSAGTGTDAMTSGNVTPTASGDLIYGISVTDSGATTPASVGTGYTIGASNGAGFGIVTESKVQAVAAAVAATFTATITGTVQCLTIALAVFAFAPLVVVPPLPRRMSFPIPLGPFDSHFTPSPAPQVLAVTTTAVSASTSFAASAVASMSVRAGMSGRSSGAAKGIAAPSWKSNLAGTARVAAYALASLSARSPLASIGRAAMNARASLSGKVAIASIGNASLSAMAAMAASTIGILLSAKLSASLFQSGSAIVLVGTSTATAIRGAAPTCNVPTHSVGDLILIAAIGSSSGTPPVVPAGFTPLFIGSIAVGYRIATSTSDTSGQWTNAVAMVCHVYSATIGQVLVGSFVTDVQAAAQFINFPTILLRANAPGRSSWLVSFAGIFQDNHGASDDIIGTAPSGMVTRTALEGVAVSELASFDTNGTVGSWTLQSMDILDDTATPFASTGRTASEACLIAEIYLTSVMTLSAPVQALAQAAATSSGLLSIIRMALTALGSLSAKAQASLTPKAVLRASSIVKSAGALSLALKAPMTAISIMKSSGALAFSGRAAMAAKWRGALLTSLTNKTFMSGLMFAAAKSLTAITGRSSLKAASSGQLKGISSSVATTQLAASAKLAARLKASIVPMMLFAGYASGAMRSTSQASAKASLFGRAVIQAKASATIIPQALFRAAMRSALYARLAPRGFAALNASMTGVSHFSLSATSVTVAFAARTLFAASLRAALKITYRIAGALPIYGRAPSPVSISGEQAPIQISGKAPSPVSIVGEQAPTQIVGNPLSFAKIKGNALMTVHDPISLLCGDTWEFLGPMNDSSGNPLNLAGASITWKLDKPDNSQNMLTLSLGSGIAITDLPSATILVTVTPTQTLAIAPSSYLDAIIVTLATGEVFTEWSGVIRAGAAPL